MTDFTTKSREAAAQGDAFAAYRLMVSAVEAEPENSDAWYGLGVALHEFKKYPAAAAAFRHADIVRPGHHETLTNLGLNLGLVGRYEEAREVLGRAVAAGPDRAEGYIHLANVEYTLAHPMMMQHALQAVAADPSSVLAHMILSFILMTNGEWKEGFAEYEWRFKYKLPEFLSAYPYPIWRGEETGTLIIVSEQGLGDNIQMMRYIPEAGKRADRVVWLCQKEMLSLAESFSRRMGRPSTGQIEIIPLPAAAPAGDAFIPTLSLPVALGIEKIEPTGPYLEIPRTTKALSSNLRVGLVWAGSSTHENARHRDMGLEPLLPLTEIQGIDFYSLQCGPPAIQLSEFGAHGLIIDLSGSITNFMDTAHQIAKLDMVISADTAVAHLAGAMGKQCWMLVNQRARDWRWGRHGERTAWYPSIKIWERALGHETWANCVREVRQELSLLVAETWARDEPR